jgi:hypothetical protein
MHRRTFLKSAARAAGGLALGAFALGAGGCYAGHFLSWMIAPRHPTKKVAAEYALDADRLVIVTYAGTDILFSYPTAPLEVSRDIVNELLVNLPKRAREIVHPVQVVQWQESNLEWPNMGLEDVARTFSADTLLYVELERYTMIEERSANLFRGRIRARVQAVQTGAGRNPVYETIVEETFPKDRPVGVLETSERTIRTGVTRFFARSLVRKFYDHEVEVQGGQ